MVMDCEAWNPGWQVAAFGWHVDDAYWNWDPFYPYRHPEIERMSFNMDGHVGTVKSNLLGQGPRVYWASLMIPILTERHRHQGGLRSVSLLNLAWLRR